MQRTKVVSTTIKSAGHSEKEGLELEFVTGTVYRFPGAPASVYQVLLKAKSAGKFFGTFIRPHFKAVEVKPK